MNTGIFLAGLGVFLYCITQAVLDVTYFIEMEPLILDLIDQMKLMLITDTALGV